MAAVPKQRWTPEEYMALESVSLNKHEYVDGEIYDLAGGSARHSQITANITMVLGSALKDRPCIVYNSDMRVKTKHNRMLAYPDVSVVCGNPILEDDRGESLVNPTVIIEVLSPSTEDFDRGRKFALYRTISSLQTFLTVAQDRPYVELAARQDDVWVLSQVEGLDAVVEIAASGCMLPLAGVYNKVTFDTELTP